MEADGIVGLVILVITLVTEIFRRKWKSEDTERDNDEIQKKKLADRRAAGWRNGNLGGVFDSSKE